MSKTSDGAKLQPQFASSGNPPTFAADLTLLSDFFAARSFQHYSTAAALIAATTGKSTDDVAMATNAPGAWFRFNGSTWDMHGIPRFADSGARSTALASPQTGWRSYLNDTQRDYIYNGTAWVGGFESVVLTMANVTVGNGTLTNMMRRDGNKIDVQGSLLFGSTTALHASLPAGVTLPSTAASRYGTASTMHEVGGAVARSAAAAKYPGSVYLEASTTVASLYNYIVIAAGGTVLPLQPMISSYLTGAGTFISWNFTYEAA